jgi:hypothetical protein
MSTKADTADSKTTIREARETIEKIGQRLEDLVPHDTLGKEFDTLNKKESEGARKLLELGNIINQELLHTYSPGNDASEEAAVRDRGAKAVKQANDILNQ